jgi:hypothetical protein
VFAYLVRHVNSFTSRKQYQKHRFLIKFSPAYKSFMSISLFVCWYHEHARYSSVHSSRDFKISSVFPIGSYQTKSYHLSHSRPAANSGIVYIQSFSDCGLRQPVLPVRKMAPSRQSVRKKRTPFVLLFFCRSSTVHRRLWKLMASDGDVDVESGDKSWQHWLDYIVKRRVFCRYRQWSERDLTAQTSTRYQLPSYLSV